MCVDAGICGQAAHVLVCGEAGQSRCDGGCGRFCRWLTDWVRGWRRAAIVATAAMGIAMLADGMV
jgi:hypothetical protein